MTAITYVRDADRVRVIFVFDLSADDAMRKLVEQGAPPPGFRLAALNPDADTSRIPMDGDDYAGGL